MPNNSFCLVPLPVIHSKIYLLNWVTESMHEYITSYVDPSYGECIDCNKRTIHICLKCHYCYSCHFKVENIEKEQRIRKHYRRQPREISEEYPVTFVTYKRNKINSNIVWTGLQPIEDNNNNNTERRYIVYIIRVTDTCLHGSNRQLSGLSNE